MYLFVVALHVILCLLLVLIVLLQPGKGGDVGAAFGGGGGGNLFGPRGPTNLLQRATTVVAVLFMVTSISLSLYSSRANRDNLDVSGAMEEAIRMEKEAEKEGNQESSPEADPAP